LKNTQLLAQWLKAKINKKQDSEKKTNEMCIFILDKTANVFTIISGLIGISIIFRNKSKKL